jgi:beta-glucanase (GH16 family)
MRALFAALLLPLLIAADCRGGTSPVGGTWHLVFEDDFSGSKLNESNWTPSNYTSVISQYDGHAAMFIADRVAVADGNLVITTTWDPRVLDGVHYNFTSGWVDSQHKRNLTRGRFEARVKMPVANATGAWPAWWLLPEGLCWPVGTEIDIVEYYVGEGHNQHSHPSNPPSMASSFHYGYSCGGDLYHYPNDTVWYPSQDWDPDTPVIDFAADFHVFGVEVNDSAVRFYVDDTENNTIFVVSAPPLCVTDAAFAAEGGFGRSRYVPWTPLYGILNVAVSQGYGATPWWLAGNSATMLVDWVRFWELSSAE